MIALIFLLMVSFGLGGCGGGLGSLGDKEVEFGTPEIQISPQSVIHQSEYTDRGTWNEVIVSLSTTSTSTGASTTVPVDGDVIVSWSSSNVKIYDRNDREILQGGSVRTESGAGTVKVKFYSHSQVEYTASVVFQYKSSTQTLEINVKKAGAARFTMNATPSSFQYKAKSTEAETTRTTTLNFYLSAEGMPLSDTLYLGSNSPNVTLDSPTVTTGNNGWGSVNATYKAGKGIEYTAVIEASYGANVVTVPFTISYEKPHPVNTAVMPGGFTFQTPLGDMGTWRSLYIAIYTTDNNNMPISAPVTLVATVDYLKMYVNGQLTNTATITTDSKGAYTLEVRYFTHEDISYTAQIIANDQFSTITIQKPEKPQQQQRRRSL